MAYTDLEKKIFSPFIVLESGLQSGIVGSADKGEDVLHIALGCEFYHSPVAPFVGGDVFYDLFLIFRIVRVP